MQDEKNNIFLYMPAMEEEHKSDDAVGSFSELINSLYQMRHAGKYQAAIEAIDDALSSHFHVDPSDSYPFSEDFLSQVYQEQHKVSMAGNELLGRLLAEKGDLLFCQNRYKESRQVLNDALAVFFYLNDRQDSFSFQRMNRMVWINQKISEIDGIVAT